MADATAAHPRSIDRLCSQPALLAYVLVAATFVLARNRLGDPDTFVHWTIGERILSTGRWPTTEEHSYTVAGDPWVAFEWLSEVVIAAAGRAGGMAAATALLVILSATLVLLVYRYAWVRAGQWRCAFAATALVLPLMAPFFTLRPQLFGYICLLLTLIAVERFRESRVAPLWFLPALFLLWVNAHGSFIVGLGILAIQWLSATVPVVPRGIDRAPWTPRQRRTLALVLLLCVGVLPLTPYGGELAVYPVKMALAQPSQLANVMEWQPVHFASWWGIGFLACLLVLLAAQIIEPLSHRAADAAMLLVFTLAACLHERFALLFLIVFVPVLAVRLRRWMPADPPARVFPRANLLAGMVVAAAIAGFLPSRREIADDLRREFPRGAVDYLRSHPIQGRLLHSYDWGSYLMWEFPENKVFIDTRADVYEFAGVLDDYFRLARLRPGGFSVLRTYKIEACLLPRSMSLATVMAELPGWTHAYEDELAVIFVRAPRGED
jgi:hypothetical protein